MKRFIRFTALILSLLMLVASMSSCLLPWERHQNSFAVLSIKTDNASYYPSKLYHYAKNVELSDDVQFTGTFSGEAYDTGYLADSVNYEHGTRTQAYISTGNGQPHVALELSVVKEYPLEIEEKEDTYIVTYYDGGQTVHASQSQAEEAFEKHTVEIPKSEIIEIKHLPTYEAKSTTPILSVFIHPDLPYHRQIKCEQIELYQFNNVQVENGGIKYLSGKTFFGEFCESGYAVGASKTKDLAVGDDISLLVNRHHIYPAEVSAIINKYPVLLYEKDETYVFIYYTHSFTYRAFGGDEIFEMDNFYPTQSEAEKNIVKCVIEVPKSHVGEIKYC